MLPAGLDRAGFALADVLLFYVVENVEPKQVTAAAKFVQELKKN